MKNWYDKFFQLLLDSYNRKTVNKSTDGLENKLERIEHKVERLEKSSFAIGMYCSGFPIFVIGISQMVNSILKSSPIEILTFIYYITGGVMVGIGMRFYYKRNKEFFITLFVFTIVLVFLTLLKLYVFKNQPA